MSKLTNLSQQLATALTIAAAGGAGGYLKNRKRKATRQIARSKKAVRTAPLNRLRVRRQAAVKQNIGMPSVTLTRNRRTFKENNSIENRATSLQVYAPRASAMKFINAIMEPQWFRAQGLSQFDTTTGFYPIANRLEPNGAIVLPMHIWDLSAVQNYNGAITLTPNVGHFCGFTGTGADSNTFCVSLKGQDENGNLQSGSCPLYKENTSGNTVSTFPIRKAFHHYTHVKMNLYGCRKRATRFKVDMMMVKEEYADFLDAADTNVEKKKVFDYLTRPFMFTNLNSGDPQVRNDVKIIKSYEVIVAPTTLDQYDGASAVPHMQTLNFFINHNRIRRYDWKSGLPASHLQNAAYDTELSTDYQSRVDNKYRPYLVVRALCPERRTLAAVNNSVDADPISEPSYDCVIRQKFSFPT